MNDTNVDNIQVEPGETPSESDEQNLHNIQDTSNELAVKSGHQNLEQFVSKGGKEEDYQSPEIFLALKGPLKKIKDQRKRYDQRERERELEFQDRMKGVQSMHKAQLEGQKAALMAQRNERIGDLDAEGAQVIQNQIDALPAAPAQAPQAPGQSQAVQDWSNDPKNAWIDTPGPKSTYAQTQFQNYLRDGHSDAQAIRNMEADIRGEYPDINPNTSSAPAVEGGTPPGNKSKAADPTMSTLTEEERYTWKHNADMWGNDQKRFLQSVKDIRGAE